MKGRGKRAHCSLPHMLIKQYVLLSMPAKQVLPDHNLERGKGTLGFLLAPQTSRMRASGKGNVFAQSTQTELPPTQHWATDVTRSGSRYHPTVGPGCAKDFFPSCLTCKNSPLSQNIIFQRAQGAPLAPMGGNSEIFCFSPQERSSHAGGWPPHPPVPGWKPDYKQCPRG